MQGSIPVSFCRALWMKRGEEARKVGGREGEKEGILTGRKEGRKDVEVVKDG